MSKKEQIRTLLKGIETGDPAAAEVVNEQKYIQHNPHTHEGNEGLAALFKRLSKTSPRVNMIRAFEDGDFAFAHMQYDFSSVKIAFEVFRFEGGQAVEHWDNLQAEQGPNPSGRSMIDGPVDIVDLELTEANRKFVGAFVEEVLINRNLDKLDDYINGENFIQHSPQIADGAQALHASLSSKTADGYAIQYDKNHRLLAEGNFVLSASEGRLNGVHTAFYDLFRVENNQLVEHWDTLEVIPPRDEWQNDNGKF